MIIGTLFLALLASSPAARQDDAEAMKKRILAEVERKLRQEEERILKEIERIIDEELRKAGGGAPDPAPAPRPAPDPAPAPVPPPVERPKGRGFLGIRPAAYEDWQPGELEKFKIAGGIRVDFLVENGPAQKAGVLVDDIILAVDGEAVEEPADLPRVIQSKQAGTEVSLRLLRGAERKLQTLKVVLGRLPQDPDVRPPEPPKPPEHDEEELRERIKKFLQKGGEPPAKPPPPERPAGERPWLGIELEELTDDVRAQLKLGENVGVAVAAVVSGSPAEAAGLKVNDILLKIDGAPLLGEEGIATFMAGAKPGQELKVTILRKGAESVLAVTLARRP